MFERDYSGSPGKEAIKRMRENGEFLRWFVGKISYMAYGVLNGSGEINLNVPKTGYFEKTSLFFEIPNTDNEGFLRFEPCEDEDDKRSFRIGVHRNGYDLVVSNYILTKATNDEISEYLTKEANLDEIEKIVLRLSDSVDDKMDD